MQSESDQTPASDTLTDKQRALIGRQLRRRRAELVGGGVVAVGRDGLLPLSWQQLGLWFLYEWDRGSATYHLPLVLRLRGGLDVSALGLAVSAVVARHEGLRTRFVVSDGQPWQVVDSPGVVVPVVVGLPVVGWERVVSGEVSRPFVLGVESGFRLFVGRLAGDDHVVVLNCHHIVSDGWSTGIVSGDLRAAYVAALAGSSDPLLGLTPLPVQPADWAHWQHHHPEELEAGLAYWTQQLADLPTLQLPVDRPRPASPTGAGAGVEGFVDAQTATGVAELAAQLHVSPLAVLLGAYSFLLRSYTGQHDLPVGSVFSGRTRTELEALVGYLANTVVLRTHLRDTDTVTEHVRRCHDTVLQAMQHQDTPFTLVVDALQPQRVPGQNPLFQTSLSLVPAQLATGDWNLPGVQTEQLHPDQGAGARFDLRCEITPQADGSMSIWIEYSTELFDAWRMRQLTGHLSDTLAAMVAGPGRRLSDLTLVGKPEHDEITYGFNHHRELPPAPLPWAGSDVVNAAEATARTEAGSCAAWCDGAWLSYGRLEFAATTLALRLAEAGVRSGDVVAVCAHRSLELVVGMLAVLKAGAAYLPLDPDQPAARSEFQLADAGAVAVLAQPGLGPGPAAGVVLIDLTPPDGARRSDPDDGSDDEYNPVPGAETLPKIDARSTAYLIYTSGSTGRPKGVLSNHAGLINRLGWMQAQYPIDRHDRVLQKTPYTFDVSVWEFFWPLLAGARLVLAAPGGHRDPQYLATALAEQRISVCHFVPSVLTTFLDQADRPELPALRHLFCSGEALPAVTRDRTLSRFPRLALHNLYGPTEASIDVTAWTCAVTDGPTVVIGRPISNMSVYVLDSAFRPVPIGVTGRLYLAGVGLATGYLGRPALTGERFVPCPFGPSGQRMYDTGDLARFRPDGTVEYHGRTDHQIKLHGQRIELGEIEHALGRFSGVTAAAVNLVDPGQGRSPFLAAYVAAASAPADAELRAYLADQLPLHMIPATITVLDELPLTSNGKLDRAQLPAPSVSVGAARVPTPSERALAEIWTSLLTPATPVRPADNFFSQGGSSLSVMQLISRIREGFGVEIAVRQVFLAPVLADLAAEIDRLAAAHVLEDVDLDDIEAQLDTLSDEEVERMLAGGLGDPAGGLG